LQVRLAGAGLLPTLGLVGNGEYTSNGSTVTPRAYAAVSVQAAVLLVIFGLLFVIGILPRLHRRPQLRAAAQAQKDPTPTVNVVPVQASPPTDVLTLPGNVQAAEQTAVNARASGLCQKMAGGYWRPRARRADTRRPVHA